LVPTQVRAQQGRVLVVDLLVSCSAVLLAAVVGDLTFTPSAAGGRPRPPWCHSCQFRPNSVAVTTRTSRPARRESSRGYELSHDSAVSLRWPLIADSVPLHLVDASPPLSGPARTAHGFGDAAVSRVSSPPPRADTCLARMPLP
jgi:hypothetical protein